MVISMSERQDWETVMYALRIALSFGGAMLLLWELRARKLRVRIPERRSRFLAIALSVLAFGAYFGFFSPSMHQRAYYHRGEFFHHYLGSKYFAELRYTGIYSCTAAAEMDLGRREAVARRDMRDLRVNSIRPVTAPEVQRQIQDCRDVFAANPRRYAAFKKDVEWFYSSAKGSYWDNMQRDHGFNASPVWTMGGKFLAAFGDADDTFFKWLSALDVILQGAAILLVFWAFGWRIGAIATIFWGANGPADFYWTGGAFLRQDWFLLLVAAVCFARKRWFVASGASLTYSALLRVFPALFLVGPGIIIGLHVVKQIRKRRRERAETGRYPRYPLVLLRCEHRKFIGGCVVALGILVPASMVVVGPGACREFAEHITVRMDTPLTDNMGLQTILAHDWDGRMRFTRSDDLEDPFQVWRQVRLERRESTKLIHWGLLVGTIVWMAWALRRTNLLWVAMGLSCLFAMSVADLNGYYFAMFILAAPIARLSKGLGPVILAAGGASQIIGSAGGEHGMFYWIDDKFAAQSHLFLVLGACVLCAYQRPFSRARLKAWWDGQPEPRSRVPPE
jgi:hypothetical protein